MMIRGLVFLIFIFTHSHSFSASLGVYADSSFQNTLIDGVRSELINVLIVKIHDEQLNQKEIIAIPSNILYHYFYTQYKMSYDDYIGLLPDLLAKKKEVDYSSRNAFDWNDYVIDNDFYKKIEHQTLKTTLKYYTIADQFRNTLMSNQINALILFFYEKGIRVYVDDVSGNYTIGY